jgi:predicted GNAT family acetyltransferase
LLPISWTGSLSLSSTRELYLGVGGILTVDSLPGYRRKGCAALSVTHIIRHMHNQGQSACLGIRYRDSCLLGAGA